ncbi:MAG: penicillin-binding protein 2 [Actinobacteria bacterium]|nr:penicillin-binding protein 2 [Actinomycetota bacterium]
MKLSETSYYRPDMAQETFQRRITMFGLFIIIVFSVLFARIWFMQIVSGGEYKKEAEGNRIREISQEAPRGKIIDRSGDVLVKNRSALTISVIPAEINKDEKVISRLSKLLGIGEKDIKEKMEKSQAPNQRAVLIASDVGEDMITYVREHQREFTGVYAGTKPVREYVYGSLGAHVIGYLGEISSDTLKEKVGDKYQAGDEIGLDGVEAVYDEELRGEVGKYQIEVDASGSKVGEISRQEPRSGYNLRLTIDKDAQMVVEDALKTEMDLARTRSDPETGNYKATGGAAVVLDPRNGEIIAMASYPTLDLNKFVGGIDVKTWNELNDPKNNQPLNNRATMSELPPGSTFKVITALGALEEGTYTMESPFRCDNVYKKGAFEKQPKSCWSTHGNINLFNGIIQSCDIVFYELGYNFYNRQTNKEGKPLWEYASDFNLGKKTGIDLASEYDGRVPNPEWKKQFNKDNKEYQVWWPGDTVNMAIGQGDLLATPLQMAYVYAGLANDGKFVRPHLIKSLEDADGKVEKEAEKEVVSELTYTKEHLEQVSAALTGVVKGKGTAAKTFEGFPLDTIPVAGKTGTSEIISKQTTAWFVCYAPANDPKYVIAVAIEQGGHGGESAAPAARRILEGLFQIETKGEIPRSPGD